MNYFASSIGPIPRKDPDEDGNYIIENFTNKYAEPSELRGPEIIDFLEKPTLGHAKAMLKRYGIHLPLSTFMTKTGKSSQCSKPLNKPSKPSKPSKLQGGKTSSIQYELLILDTMHDLLGTEPQNMYMIFKNEIDLPKHLKDLFLKSSYSFTRDAALYIETKANLAVQHLTVDIKTKKTHDVELMNMISSWNNLSFVLDNFAACFKNSGGGPQSQSVMMLIGCAYLIVLLSNMKHLDKLPRSCQNIVFIDGFFMSIDGSYISRFFTLFCKTIKRLTLLDTHVRPLIKVKNVVIPRQFCKIYQVDASVSQTHISLNGNQYDIFPPNPLPNQIYYPHTKKDFFHHVKSNKSNKDLWFLNFLRDAFKADVAIETDSVFVTHDRFAFTYYKFAGGRHGFLICVDSDGENCEYHVSF